MKHILCGWIYVTYDVKSVFRKDMKIISQILICFVLSFTLQSQAQERKARPRSECNSLCVAHFKDPERSPIKYVTKLLELREAIAKESDPEKLKLLREKEQSELEDYLDKLEKRCDNFCKLNPD